jgi:predicted unusual protein kinase regulating ubiquinone biosynthesis (AarF/ABC1/UbiB family)
VSVRDQEQNRLSSRLWRYASVGAGVGTATARVAAGRLLNSQKDFANEARLFRETLGGLKGPLMKVAQLMATIPDVLPADYARELQQLQSHAPPMGWPFVRRRMAAELGPDWQARYRSFEHEASAAASLGQVHRARSLQGEALACKLQYPDMESAVEADLAQLNLLFAIHRRMDPVIDTSGIAVEIGARLREELDYGREARHMTLYRHMLKPLSHIRVPQVLPELSTRRLLTMTWLEGVKLLEFKGHPLEVRNLLARSLFEAWWRPFCGYAVIHGDPHLGNYSALLGETGEPQGLNLLDYGCIRIFPPRFTEGVIDLYHGLIDNDRARMIHAYETWGFQGLSNELVDILNIWARFIYGPLMEDRVRALADGVSPAEYGRKQAFLVHRALKEKGPVKVPREFVFMDRAAIGLGGVFIHLRAELNFHCLFNAAIEDFSVDAVAARQAAALRIADLEGETLDPLP